MKKAKILLYTGMIALITEVASACAPILSTDARLTLGQNQSWQLQYVVVLSSGGGVLQPQFQDTLTQTVGQAKLQEVNATWQILPSPAGNTNISYQIQFSGTGFDKLDRIAWKNQPAVSLRCTQSRRG